VFEANIRQIKKKLFVKSAYKLTLVKIMKKKTQVKQKNF